MEAFIGANYSHFEDAVKKDGDLGCEGICTNCPWPQTDRYDSQDAQIRGCWAAVSSQYQRLVG